VFTLILCLASALSAQQTPQERQLFEQLNQSRQKAGLPALEWDERLAQAAREHTKLMASKNQLAHVLPGEPEVGDRFSATGIRFNRSGENVGYNTYSNDLHSAWMESQGHRDNILSPNYNVVGIAVVQSDEGLFYATQDFAHALPLRTPQQAEDLVAESVTALRQKEGRNPLQRLDKPAVHKLACDMAQKGKLNAQQAADLPEVRESLVYNNSRPEELPAQARKLLHNDRITQFAVGACFTGDQANNPGGTFYVVITFY
jgi:Cysteine-rich secretory protein family